MKLGVSQLSSFSISANLGLVSVLIPSEDFRKVVLSVGSFNDNFTLFHHFRNLSLSWLLGFSCSSKRMFYWIGILALEFSGHVAFVVPGDPHNEQLPPHSCPKKYLIKIRHYLYNYIRLKN